MVCFVCLVETPEILVQQCWMVRKIIQVIPIGKFVLMLQKAANRSVGKYESELIPFAIWVVVSDIYLFSTLSPGKWSNLTCHIFFNWGPGKNQQESCPFNQPTFQPTCIFLRSFLITLGTGGRLYHSCFVAEDRFCWNFCSHGFMKKNQPWSVNRSMRGSTFCR